MDELLATLARQLVDHPEEVRVTQTENGGEVLLQLRVAPDDLGKVIGKQGRTARALRTVLAAAATKQNQRTLLEIVED